MDALLNVISRERIGRFLTAARGCEEAALALYLRNTRLSEGFYLPLQMVEVCLRNRFHDELSKIYSDDWYDQNGLVTDVYQRDQITKAKLDIIRERKVLSQGRLVAALTFGFWTACLHKKYEDRFWRKALYKAFSHSGHAVVSKQVRAEFHKIRNLRNRIAHHEPVFHLDLPALHESICVVTGWMSPEAEGWIRGHSRFNEIYESGE